MKQLKSKYQLNEDGISLVEVVASVVLLTIILLSVFYMLIQSSKTAATSEEIIDATYIAQTEMELLYSKTTDSTYNSSNYDTAIINQGYAKINGTNVYKKNNMDPNFYIELTTNSNTSGLSNLTRVLIKVYDKEDGVLKAQMESTLDWGS